MEIRHKSKTLLLGFLAALHWVHWAVIILSLGLTLSAWYFTKQQVEERVANQFNREAEQVVALIQERMRKYEEALWAGVATIHAQGAEITGEQWRRFSKTLRIDKRYPGINGIGIIYRVLPEDLESYLANERIARPDYTIHPPHNQDEYWPITHIEPVAPNAKAVGLDMAHENNRFTAAKKARDTGTAQITGPIVLVQDAEQTPGFLFYAPYYKKGVYDELEERKENFIGLVYAPFIMKKLMQGTLDKENRHVGVSIYDGSDSLYDEHMLAEGDFDADPLFERSFSIDLYGRPWVFDVRSAKSFREASANNQPLFILFAGLIIDSLLLGLFLMLTRANEQSKELAKVKSLALKESDARLKKTAKRMEAVLDGAGEGICGLNLKGETTFANRAAEHMLGYTIEEMLNKSYHELIQHHRVDGSEYALAESNILKSYKEGKRHTEDQEVFWTKDGTAVPVEYTSTPVYSDKKKLEGAVVVFRDISERKEAERARDKLINELQHSNRELDDFAYIASHDLKEPLRGIHNHSRFLMKDFADVLDEGGNHKLERVMLLAQRMEKLINDLLYYSRLGRTELAWQKTDLNAVVEEIKQMLAEDDARAVRIAGALPIKLCDRTKVTELLRNLIANALKYNQSEEKMVELGEIETHRDGKNIKAIYVKDNGIGIPKKHYENIFKIFKRLHHKEAYDGGTGSGLTFVKKIVEQHGGEIWLESVEQEGTTFYFTLQEGTK